MLMFVFLYSPIFYYFIQGVGPLADQAQTERAGLAINLTLLLQCSDLCTLGMGVILWGESPMYVNPVNMSFMLA